MPPPPRSTLFPYTTLFRSTPSVDGAARHLPVAGIPGPDEAPQPGGAGAAAAAQGRRPGRGGEAEAVRRGRGLDRKSTRLNSSHLGISYAVFCLKKKKNKTE